MRNVFSEFARMTAGVLGSATAFVVATASIVVWLAVGPLFGWSDAWQLWVNTGTTVITFLMVFVIQNAQNRDTRAIQIKLDELIRAVGPAMTGLVDIEKLSDDELKRLQERFTELRERHETETNEAAQDLMTAVSEHERREAETELESETSRRAGQSTTDPSEAKREP